jgi:small subunit ribosomal protein S4e
MIIGGNNIGRVGTLMHLEKHAGSFDIAHLKDKVGHEFATRKANVMVIGKGE